MDIKHFFVHGLSAVQFIVPCKKNIPWTAVRGPRVNWGSRVRTKTIRPAVLTPRVLWVRQLYNINLVKGVYSNAQKKRNASPAIFGLCFCVRFYRICGEKFQTHSNSILTLPQLCSAKTFANEPKTCQKFDSWFLQNILNQNTTFGTQMLCCEFHDHGTLWILYKINQLNLLKLQKRFKMTLELQWILQTKRKISVQSPSSEVFNSISQNN